MHTLEGCMKHRQFYPENWEALAWECKQRAGWRCEHCGIALMARRSCLNGQEWCIPST